MYDTSFSWQLVRGNVCVQRAFNGTKIYATWSGKAPRCEYIARSDDNVRKVYFFAGRSIDIVKAILKELLGELHKELLQSLNELLRKRQHEEDDEPSRKRQRAVLHALLQYLSPATYPHLTIFCIDQSYWRFPAVGDLDEFPCPGGVISMAMPQHTTFKPWDWLKDALPDATEAQVNDVFEGYEKRWTEMNRQQHREMLHELEQLAKNPVDFRNIPLEADDNEDESDQDLCRDRQLWTMKHGPRSSRVLYEVASRFALKQNSTTSSSLISSIRFNQLHVMPVGAFATLLKWTFATCFGSGEDEAWPASAAPLIEKQVGYGVAQHQLECAT